MITLVTRGRRIYIEGAAYGMRDTLRYAGAHWGSEQRAWWTASAPKAQSLLTKLQACDGQPQRDDHVPPDGVSSVVAGRTRYKGRTYYLAGRQYRDEAPRPVQTGDGAKYLLYFRDGSRQFWAPSNLVEIVKSYRSLQTIDSLREYAAGVRAHGSAEAYAAAQAEQSDRCRECGGPLTDAPHQHAMGGYCGACAYDVMP